MTRSVLGLITEVAGGSERRNFALMFVSLIVRGEHMQPNKNGISSFVVCMKRAQREYAYAVKLIPPCFTYVRIYGIPRYR